MLLFPLILILLFGLVAVYLHQHDRLTGLGHVGLFVALSGAAMSVGGVWSQVFVTPYLIAEAPQLLEQSSPSVLAGYILSYNLLGLGALLFSIATLLSRAFPRWTSVLDIAGAVICVGPLPSRFFLFAVAVTSWSLYTRQPRQLPASTRVPANVA